MMPQELSLSPIERTTSHASNISNGSTKKSMVSLVSTSKSTTKTGSSKNSAKANSTESRILAQHGMVALSKKPLMNSPILCKLRHKNSPVSAAELFRLWKALATSSNTDSVNKELVLKIGGYITNSCHFLAQDLNLTPSCCDKFKGFVFTLSSMLGSKNLQLDRIINFLITGYDFFVAPISPTAPTAPTTTIKPITTLRKTTPKPKPPAPKPYEQIASTMCKQGERIWSRRNPSLSSTPTRLIEEYLKDWHRDRFDDAKWDKEVYSWNNAPPPAQDMWDTFLIENLLHYWRKPATEQYGDRYFYNSKYRERFQWYHNKAEEQIWNDNKPGYCRIKIQDKNKLCNFIWDKMKPTLKADYLTYHLGREITSNAGEKNLLIISHQAELEGHGSLENYFLNHYPQAREAFCVSYYNDTSMIKGWDATTTPAPTTKPITTPRTTTSPPIPKITTPAVTFAPFPTVSGELAKLSSSLSTAAVICFSLVPTLCTEIPKICRMEDKCKNKTELLRSTLNLLGVSCVTLSSIINLSAQMHHESEPEVHAGSVLAALGSGIYAATGLWSAYELYQALRQIQASVKQLESNPSTQALLLDCAKASAKQTNQRLQFDLIKNVGANCAYTASHLYDLMMPQFFAAAPYLKMMPCMLANALSLTTMTKLSHERQQINESLLDVNATDMECTPLILLQQTAMTYAEKLTEQLGEAYHLARPQLLAKLGANQHSDKTEMQLIISFLSALTSNEKEIQKIITAVEKIYGFKPAHFYKKEHKDEYIKCQTSRILLKYLSALRQQDKCLIFPCRGFCYSNSVYNGFISPMLKALAYHQLKQLNEQAGEHMVIDVDEDSDSDIYQDASENGEYGINMSYYNSGTQTHNTNQTTFYPQTAGREALNAQPKQTKGSSTHSIPECIPLLDISPQKSDSPTPLDDEQETWFDAVDSVTTSPQTSPPQRPVQSTPPLCSPATRVSVSVEINLCQISAIPD